MALTATQILCPNAGITSLSGLENFTNVTQVVLSGNGITDPSPLYQLPGLQTLRLDGNQLTSLAGSINWSALQLLDVSSNNLSGSASLDIGFLGALQTLVVSGNQLTAVDVSAATTLVSADLSDNRLTSVIGNTSNWEIMTQLTQLWLQDNALTTVGSLAPLHSHLRTLLVTGNAGFQCPTLKLPNSGALCQMSGCAPTCQ
jgi:Leucine-rich repeat (LRR) protein